MSLFEGTALKDLLFKAIQYGEREEVKARLFRQVDGAADQGHLMRLLQRRALTNDTMPEARVEEIRLEMERAEAQRLQPCHVQSFFVEAFQHLGGRLKRREEGRWEITHVPAVHSRARPSESVPVRPIQRRYERICFEKGHIDRQPVAAFICPGHPLLEAVIGMVREKYGHLMRQGAVLVDETDLGEERSAVVLLEHGVRDGRTTATGKPHIVSEKLQFAAIGRDGSVLDAGIAPHLNLRPARPEEAALLDDPAAETWLHGDIERAAIEFATAELARAHVAEVRARRLPEIEKVEREVHARLKKEINYWDARAFELKEQERAGKKTRLNWQNAARRAEDLAERLKRRTDVARARRGSSHRTAAPRAWRHVSPPPRPDRSAGTRDQRWRVSSASGRLLRRPGCAAGDRACRHGGRHGRRARPWQYRHPTCLPRKIGYDIVHPTI